MKQTASKRNNKLTWIGGIVGNPEVLENEWTDHQMEALKDLGINMLQLNLGWGGRPGGEVLNMEDLDEERLEQFHFRVQQAAKVGITVMPHFGVPQLLNMKEGYSVVYPACILHPEVIRNYTDRLAQFVSDFTAIDNIMIYTFDQDSWLCSEFGDCPRCSGIPLHERLPHFLNQLQEALQQGRPGTRLWWQPWELSAGQTYKVMQNVSPEHFGIIINNSIAETYPSNTTDLWVRNTVRIAAERGIPVIGELQFTGCQIGTHSVQRLPCPELVYEQARAFYELEGVMGLREHFGIAVSKMSVNTDMFRQYVKNPDAPMADMLAAVAAGYGTNATEELLTAWRHASRAVQHIPFEASYSFCNVTHLPPGHSWDAAVIPAFHWDTPAWETGRRAFYMLTHPTTIHPWMLEDVGLRLGEAADGFFAAAEALQLALDKGVDRAEDVHEQWRDLMKLGRSVRGTSLHYLETVAAYGVRVALKQENEAKFKAACSRLDSLLLMDIDNQEQDVEVKALYEAFRKDPAAWVRLHLQQPYLYNKSVKLEPFDQKM